MRVAHCDSTHSGGNSLKGSNGNRKVVLILENASEPPGQLVPQEEFQAMFLEDQ